MSSLDSCSASSATWRAGSSTWLTSPGPAEGRRRARAVASRASARTVPPLTTARSVTPPYRATARAMGSIVCAVLVRNAA